MENELRIDKLSKDFMNKIEIHFQGLSKPKLHENEIWRIQASRTKILDTIDRPSLDESD